MTDSADDIAALRAPLAERRPLRLPPVDVYRQPLIEPLGYMVLHASWFENRMFSFIGLLLPFGPDTTLEQVAHKLRNWDLPWLEKVVRGAIVDEQLLEDVVEFLGRVERVRGNRHRLVHDAMEVGILPIGQLGDGGGYRAVLLREEYAKVDKSRSIRQMTPVTPEDVAQVAYAFYDLGLEIDTFLGRLTSS